MFLLNFAILAIATCTVYSHTLEEIKVGRAIECAHRIIKDDVCNGRKRWQQGIDLSVEKYKMIVPPVLNGKDNKYQASVVLPAKLINSLNYCKEREGLNMPLSDLLMKRNTYTYRDMPSFLGKCPYKLDGACEQSMKYRRADGACNNFQNPLYGSSGIPFVRELPPVYEGKDNPRQHGVGGERLPSTRLISVKVHTLTSQPPVTQVTSFYTGFGQLLSHDVTNTPMETGYNGVIVSCCKNPDRKKCFDIDIPADDPFFSQFNRSCMGFRRSAEGTDLNCEKGVREQLNVATAFIDCSTVYGDSNSNLASLRTFEKGMLLQSFGDQVPIRMHQNAKARDLGISLFRSGDPKINESPQLYLFSLVFTRVHNKIATILAEMNKNWNDEDVFQETRKIVVAFMQHVVYNEYLNVTLSDDLMTQYDLRSLPSRYYEGYDSSVNPSLANVFSTVGMRFGHSMLNNDLVFANRQYQVDIKSTLLLKDAFFRPLTFVSREMDVARGQVVTPSEDVDRTFVDGMRNRLFQTKEGNGLDIVALNLQRGRDHGLPAYGKFRELYGLSAPNDWQLSSFPDIRPEDVELLKMVYRSPEDIDLYTGAVAEIPVNGRTVGPLFAEILARQFNKIKKGDRFWYETDEEPQRFTSVQLQEIRKISLAKILCYAQELDSIQADPFLLQSSSNPSVLCTDIPMISFEPWRAN